MKTLKSLNLNTLILVSLLTLPSLPALACQGGSCGGGGSVIKGMTVDTYLQKNQADKEALKGAVSEKLDALEKKLPEFARELRGGFDKLDWYMVDVPLEQLPFSRTKVPFAIKQASIQIEDNVFTSKDEFGALNKDEQAKHVVHELVRRIFLAAEGTNTQVTEGSVAKATNVIFDESAKLSAKELREKLETLGYQTKNISYGAEKNKNRKLASAPNLMEIPVKLKHPITILEARAITSSCLGGPQASLLKELAAAFKGEPAPRSGQDQVKPESSMFFVEAEPMPSLLPSFAGYSRKLQSVNESCHGPYCGDTYLETVATYSAGSDDIRAGEMGRSAAQGYPGIKNPKVLFLNELVLEGGLPSIVYKGAENEPVYTEFGLTNQERHIEEISVVAGKNWMEDDGMVAMKNRKSGVTIPLKVNGKGYVDCLRNGFESVSKKPLVMEPGKADPRFIEGFYSPKVAPSAGTSEGEDSGSTSNDAK